MKRMMLLLLTLALTVPAFAQVQQESQGQPEQAGQRGKHGRRGGKIFKQMDKNNDRQISRDEWAGKPETFSQLDRNNDGMLTGAELKEARKQRRPR